MLYKYQTKLSFDLYMLDCSQTTYSHDWRWLGKHFEDGQITIVVINTKNHFYYWFKMPNKAFYYIMIVSATIQYGWIRA